MHHLIGECSQEKTSEFCEQFVLIMLKMNSEQLKEKKAEILDYAQNNGANDGLLSFLYWAFSKAIEIKQDEEKEQQHIADELKIIAHHPLVGFTGTYMGKFFQTIMNRSAEEGSPFVNNSRAAMSQAYTYGLINGIRQERARRKKGTAV